MTPCRLWRWIGLLLVVGLAVGCARTTPSVETEMDQAALAAEETSEADPVNQEARASIPQASEPTEKTFAKTDAEVGKAAEAPVAAEELLICVVALKGLVRGDLDGIREALSQESGIEQVSQIKAKPGRFALEVTGRAGIEEVRKVFSRITTPHLEIIRTDSRRGMIWCKKATGVY